VGRVAPGRARPLRLTIACLVVAMILSSCGGGGGGSGDESTGKAVDTGATITMWTRSATEAASRRLVDKYNATHKNQVKLTPIPTDNYQPRIAAAAGAKNLPDVFAADVIFMPQYTSKGLFLDITDRIDALPFKDHLAPSHIELGTYQGRKYGLPHTLDLSVLFYNKVLYEKAGLDPEKPPTTLKEFADHARTIREKVGGNVYGTFWGGSCGGCYVFTYWPSIWAGGGEVMNKDGSQSTIDSPQSVAVFNTYNQLWHEGVVPASAKDERGPTWTGFFPKGIIGVMPMPSTTLGAMPDNAKVKVGVAPIPGPDGGESTFVGGDSIGISATSKHPDQAWDFISWTVSDEAQVEVLAKNKDVLARPDLANNKYSKEDPRVVLINEMVGKGRTPYALNFGQTYNDPNGPWIPVARDAVFGPDAAKALKDGAPKITESLGQS
jgi:multiple sugar transport system substrate-binding protein